METKTKVKRPRTTINRGLVASSDMRRVRRANEMKEEHTTELQKAHEQFIKTSFFLNADFKKEVKITVEYVLRNYREVSFCHAWYPISRYSVDTIDKMIKEHFEFR